MLEKKTMHSRIARLALGSLLGAALCGCPDKTPPAPSTDQPAPAQAEQSPSTRPSDEAEPAPESRPSDEAPPASRPADRGD